MWANGYGFKCFRSKWFYKINIQIDRKSTHFHQSLERWCQNVLAKVFAYKIRTNNDSDDFSSILFQWKTIVCSFFASSSSTFAFRHLFLTDYILVSFDSICMNVDSFDSEHFKCLSISFMQCNWFALTERSSTLSINDVRTSETSELLLCYMHKNMKERCVHVSIKSDIFHPHENINFATWWHKQISFGCSVKEASCTILP